MSAASTSSSVAAEAGGKKGGKKTVTRADAEKKKTELLPSILDAYLGSEYKPGKTMTQVSKEMGIPTRTLYRWMLTGLGDKKYQEKVTECLVARLADADDELEAAKDPVEVQKWREIARFRRMDFERRRPALYGPRAVVQPLGILAVDTELMESMTKLLEAASPKLIKGDTFDADAG